MGKKPATSKPFAKHKKDRKAHNVNFDDMDPEDFNNMHISALYVDAMKDEHKAFTYIRMLTRANLPNRQLQSVHVKVDTGAGHNVMPLHVFAQLYPDYLNKNGYPIGLTQTGGKMYSYNNVRIPQFGSLKTQIQWTPKDGSSPRTAWSTWYVTDS